MHARDTCQVLHRDRAAHAAAPREARGPARHGAPADRQGEAPGHRESGYMPIDEEGSRLLFQVISDSYETRSVVYTTNIEFSGWGRVLGDKNMAAALIDRTVHHGRLAGFEGGSYRSEHALMTRQPRKKGRRVPTAQFPLETSRLCCRKIVPILWTPTCRNTYVLHPKPLVVENDVVKLPIYMAGLL